MLTGCRQSFHFNGQPRHHQVHGVGLGRNRLIGPTEDISIDTPERIVGHESLTYLARNDNHSPGALPTGAQQVVGLGTHAFLGRFDVEGIPAVEKDITHEQCHAIEKDHLISLAGAGQRDRHARRLLQRAPGARAGIPVRFDAVGHLAITGFGRRDKQDIGPADPLGQLLREAALAAAAPPNIRTIRAMKL